MIKTFETALHHLVLGRQPVLIQSKDKRPVHTGWQDKIYESSKISKEDFPDGHNLGLRLGPASGNLVDVDLDCDEARIIASSLLPPTEMVHGRDSAQESHYWFIDDGLNETKQFKDLEGRVIVEYRGFASSQTVIPPSIHPSGEHLVWHKNGDPGKVTALALLRSVGKIASITLLARAWPPSGARHEAALVLAGALAKAGWQQEEAEGFVEAVCYLAQDTDVKDRLAAVGSSYKALKENKPVTGKTALTKLFGGNLVAKLDEWLDLDSEEDKATKNVPNKIIALVGKGLFQTPGGTGYILSDGGPIFLDSKFIKAHLAGVFRDNFGVPPKKEHVNSALDILAYQAKKAEIKEVYIRVGHKHDSTYIDLGNADRSIVEINKEGWWVVDKSPLDFLRVRGFYELPIPDEDGSLKEFRELINLDFKDERQWALLLAWLVYVLNGRGPFPVLVVNGEQGAAKSTLCKFIKRLIDPDSKDVVAFPEDPRNLMIMANNSYLLCFDNISYISNDLSDFLCGIATGRSLVTRELWTNSDEQVFATKRPVVLNGIDNAANRGDLLDRAVTLHLPVITRANRKTEEEIWKHFEEIRPKVLGALLNTLVFALNKKDDIRLPGTNRMADFQIMAMASEEYLGLKPGVMAYALESNDNSSKMITLEESPIFAPLEKVVHKLVITKPEKEIRTTAAQLMDMLSDQASDNEKRSRGWPNNFRLLGSHLRRLAPALRMNGIDLAFEKTQTQRLIIIKYVEKGLVN